MVCKARHRCFGVQGALHHTLALCLAATALVACGGARDPILLATTTSVANSGLLDAVLPSYPATVRPVLVGSGRALEMLASGHADVVVSHAPAREADALAQHPSWWYRKLLFNDFLIVGPSEDPAGIRSAGSAAEAMRKIAESSAVFLSRGDESGTHERERQLWRAAGTEPASGRLVIAGAGMGQTLRVASSTGAYTLTDRGTFENMQRSLASVPLYQGDPELLNTYAVIADPDRARGAEFARWLAEGEGFRVLRDVLESGTVAGFTAWPPDAPRGAPSDVPWRSGG